MCLNWPQIPELWNCLSRYEDRWRFCYPALEIEREVLRMAEWIEANPRHKPRNFKRFMVRWLARNQAAIERAEAREMIERAQRRADASVGLWEGYRR